MVRLRTNKGVSEAGSSRHLCLYVASCSIATCPLSSFIEAKPGPVRGIAPQPGSDEPVLPGDHGIVTAAGVHEPGEHRTHRGQCRSARLRKAGLPLEEPLKKYQVQPAAEFESDLAEVSNPCES